MIICNVKKGYSGCSFPDSSIGKECACNAGDPGSIPGVGGDPLEKGKATHSSILAWRTTIVHGVAKSWTGLIDFHFHSGCNV